MHETQKKILQISSTHDLSKLKLREIGVLVGVPHPQKVKHHLEQLKKHGILKVEVGTGALSPVVSGEDRTERIINIPILGNANCGEATLFADEYLTGYLKVSTNLVRETLLPYSKDLFAVKVYGDSMNTAKIPSGRLDFANLEEGDYAIINKRFQTPKTGTYVLSVIDGAANIKKYVVDRTNNQIVLVSDSTKNYPPIHIDESMSYLVNGEVVQVVKAPKY